jgi:predicted TIM-barrel fold metal-dependent hydrolase
MMSTNRKKYFILLFSAFLLLLSPSCNQEVAQVQEEDALSDLRLVDYEPQSMLVVKQTAVPRSKYPAIDIHNHLRHIVDSGEDISKLVQIMDECNVKAVVDLDGGFGETLDRHLKLLKGSYPDRFIVYARIDWSKIDDPDFSEYSANQLEEAVRKGAQGLKISKALGLGVKEADGSYLRVDSPKLDAVWEKCAELGIPVEIHTADPAAFFTPFDKNNEWFKILLDHQDWMFNKPEFYSREELHQQRNNVIDRHPNTTFIGAHMGNCPEDLDKVAGWLDKYPNFYVDVDARLGELGRQPYSARKFLIKYADRVMFGTDGYKSTPINAAMYRSHWRFLETDDEYMDIRDSHTVVPDWRVYGLYLPDEILEKIYHLNAEKLIPGIG